MTRLFGSLFFCSPTLVNRGSAALREEVVQLKRVLIVDGNSNFLAFGRRQAETMRQRAEFRFAATREEALDIFYTWSPEIIAVSGFLKGDHSPPEESCALVEALRAAGFEGRMVAASREHADRLYSAGCDIPYPDKNRLFQALEELIFLEG